MKMIARTLVVLGTVGATLAFGCVAVSGATPTQTLRANPLGVAWIGPAGTVPAGANVSSAKVTILVNGKVAARLVSSAWAARGAYTAVSAYTWRPRADRWGTFPAGYYFPTCRVNGIRIVQDRTARETYVDYQTHQTMTLVSGQATIAYSGVCTAMGGLNSKDLTYTSRWNADESFYFISSGVPNLLTNANNKTGDAAYPSVGEVQVLIPGWGTPVSKTFTRTVRII